MKSFIIFFLFVAGIIVIVKSELQIRVELLNPNGTQVLLEHHEGIDSATIYGRISVPPFDFGGHPIDEFAGNMTLRDDGWWVYKNLTAPVNQGDKILLTILPVIYGKTENKGAPYYILTEIAIADDAQRVAA